VDAFTALLAVLLGYSLPGIAIAVGFMVLVWRLPKPAFYWLLRNPLFLEVPVLWLAWQMHGGTLVGGMAVVMAGLTTFLIVNVSRWWLGNKINPITVT
jgi:hypothetical protein